MDFVVIVLHCLSDCTLLLCQNIFQKEESEGARLEYGERNSEEKKEKCCYFQIQHDDLADGTLLCISLNLHYFALTNNILDSSLSCPSAC